jgi:pentatricopeptide repeat protein
LSAAIDSREATHPSHPWFSTGIQIPDGANSHAHTHTNRIETLEVFKISLPRNIIFVDEDAKMALREKNPNVLAPTTGGNSNWNVVESKKKKKGSDFAFGKENLFQHPRQGRATARTSSNASRFGPSSSRSGGSSKDNVKIFKPKKQQAGDSAGNDENLPFLPRQGATAARHSHSLASRFEPTTSWSGSAFSSHDDTTFSKTKKHNESSAFDQENLLLPRQVTARPSLVSRYEPTTSWIGSQLSSNDNDNEAISMLSHVIESDSSSSGRPLAESRLLIPRISQELVERHSIKTRQTQDVSLPPHYSSMDFVDNKQATYDEARVVYPNATRLVPLSKTPGPRLPSLVGTQDSTSAHRLTWNPSPKKKTTVTGLSSAFSEYQKRTDAHSLFLHPNDTHLHDIRADSEDAALSLLVLRDEENSRLARLQENFQPFARPATPPPPLSSHGRLPSPRRLDYQQDQLDIESLLPRTTATLTRSDYVDIISDYATRRGGGGPEKAERILRHIIKEYYSGRSTVRPDGGCYNKVIHAYAERGDARMAEAILQLMCDVYDDNSDTLAEPNHRHYTTLIYAWQRSKDPQGPERCERILMKMHELHESGVLRKCKPDAFSYTSVLHCWADSKRPDAPRRAEALFRKMLDRFYNGDEDLLPDTIAYSNLINVFDKDGARAEGILWEMVDHFLKGNVSCKPTTRNFNTVLAVWSTSTDPLAPIHSEAIVRRWLNLIASTNLKNVKPDNYSYCLLLKSW